MIRKKSEKKAGFLERGRRGLARSLPAGLQWAMCWYCGSPVTLPEPIGRSLRCDGCGKDLRCCMNCRFFRAGPGGGCTESGAERPAERDRANFCDWFALNPVYRGASAGRKKDREEASAARSTFDDLFK
ncbi:MAG: hypothetical protein LBQ55_07625 [Treponema sp.]|jgi:hypothetical protein|nr:hypothetical protein [Treponema sp.]